MMGPLRRVATDEQGQGQRRCRPSCVHGAPRLLPVLPLPPSCLFPCGTPPCSLKGLPSMGLPSMDGTPLYGTPLLRGVAGSG